MEAKLKTLDIRYLYYNNEYEMQYKKNYFFYKKWVFLKDENGDILKANRKDDLISKYMFTKNIRHIIIRDYGTITINIK